MVLGYDGIYFSNDAYLRFYAGSWQVTSSLNGTWYNAEHRHVPDRLRSHRRYNRHHRNSPPPHAPAHGHRYRHQHGVDLVFDSGVGAYIVLGFDNLFFFNNNYMRFYDGYWHHADRHDGRWLRSRDKHVPQKLRKARKKNKKEFFKNINKRYRKDHHESREYRRKHGDHRNKGERDKRRKNDYEKRGEKKKYEKKDRRDDDKNYKRDRDRDRDEERDREKRDGGWLR